MDLATPYDRFRDLLDRLASVGDAPDDDVDLRMRKHALALTAVGLVPASLLWAVLGIVIDRPLLVTSSAAFALLLVLGLMVLARLKVFIPVVRAMLLAGLAYVFLGHVALGGMAAGGASLAWGILAPVSAVLYFDRSNSLRWFVGYAALVVLAIFIDGFVVSTSPASWDVAPIWLISYNLLGPALVILLLIRFVDGQRLLAQHQARALLLDMLPASIAERLARGERLIAETHPSATVVFADVVDFTGLATHLTPRDLLLVLNQLFLIFDRLAARYGLEKIKTVGDAYVAIAGAPVPREDHAQAAVEMAIEMHRAVARLGGLRRRGIRLRVGMASGPVTAGVLGENKWVYDIWGDTVNLASRMESTGITGRVQLAPATRALLDGSIPMTARTLSVKGKGMVTTYLVNPADAPRFYHRPAAAGATAVAPAGDAEPEAIATPSERAFAGA